MGLYDDEEEDDMLDTDVARSPYEDKFLSNIPIEGGSAVLEDVTGMDEDQFKETLGAEMAKGEASDLPETSMGAISLLKNEKEGSEPYASREEFDADLSGRQGEIKAAKAKLYGALESGGELTSSQTLALGVLALGLITAGAAAKGKSGIAAGAEAFNTGGQLFLKQKGANDKENKQIALKKIGDLEKEEGQIRTQQMKNDTAGFEREERIGEKIAYRKRLEKEGIQSGNTINIDSKVETEGSKLITKDLLDAEKSYKVTKRSNDAMRNQIGTLVKAGSNPDETFLDAVGRNIKGKILPGSPEGKLQIIQVKNMMEQLEALTTGAPSNRDSALLEQATAMGYNVPLKAILETANRIDELNKFRIKDLEDTADDRGLTIPRRGQGAPSPEDVKAQWMADYLANKKEK